MSDRAAGKRSVIDRDGLDALIAALREDGHAVHGPVLRDGAILHDAIESSADLPAGWTEIHEAGRYRVERREDDALFGFTTGPQSWKRLLHPPEEVLFRARRGDEGLVIEAPEKVHPKYAFIGVRACDLRAIAIQDRVFATAPAPDSPYARRRDRVFLVAVNCGEAGATCFCASMGTGPRAEAGYDIALTELLDDGGHRFLAEAGSERGAGLLARIGGREATPVDLDAAARATQRALQGMGRRLETDGLKELLQGNLEHDRWDEVAGRCLACGNCTMVCPTCFCTTVEDSSDLAGATAERVRRWDSCFTLDFSHVHGGSVRQSTRARYRQWMTHKLAGWIDQFGESGCVGCGRCITWCPVGIDITEEAAAIRARPRQKEAGDAAD